MQCFIPLLQPNKRIGIVIPFHLHLFSRLVIPFSNGIDILRTKRGVNELIDQTQNWWNVPLVERIFPSEIVELI